MARAFVLVALVAALCSASFALKVEAGENTWIAVPHVSDEQLQLMVDLFDVRGHYDGLAIIAGNEKIFSEVRRVYLGATMFAKRAEGHTLVVFEKEALLRLENEPANAWKNAAVAGLESINVRIVRATNDRIFALVAEPLRETLFAVDTRASLPINTEILPVAPRRLRRIGVAAKQRLQAKKKALKHNFSIDELLAQVNSTVIHDYVTYLTGERADSTLNTRNAYSEEAKDAAEWISDHYASCGYALLFLFLPFLPLFVYFC